MANVVLPVVRLFFPCRRAVFDLADGSWSLKRPIHTVTAGANYPQRGAYVYAQVSDGVGRFNMSVQVRDFGTGLVVARTRPTPVTFRGGQQLDVKEIVFRIVSTPFDTPGVYDFVLRANYVELEGATYSVRVTGR